MQISALFEDVDRFILVEHLRSRCADYYALMKRVHRIRKICQERAQKVSP